MIPKAEILEKSSSFGLTPNVIEKDYVLGWILAGIHQHPLLSKWAFKGGTCLKKCYFDTYRFSEDLDFTLLEKDQINREFLMTAFSEVSDWINEKSGIELPAEQMSFDIYPNPRGNDQCQGKIGYVGPMLFRQKSLPKVKLDLGFDEVVVNSPIKMPVFHEYSDADKELFQILTYSFEEAFAEKTRALLERLRPRDLYDVIHLYRHDELQPNKQIVLTTLEEKCKFKEIKVPTLVALERHSERKQIELGWEQSLKHQLSELPSFEQFWDELKLFFAWLYGSVSKPKLQEIPLGGNPFLRQHLSAIPHAFPIQKVRFAAANHLCVELTYGGTKRLIEPYSLRTTKDGNVLLQSIKHLSQEARSYRLDRIEGAEISPTPFTPKYRVELTASGTQPAPQLVRERSSDRYVPRKTLIRRPYGMQYVYKCGVCNKLFYRKNSTGRFKRHKHPSGHYMCSGTPYFVGTK